MVVTVRVSKLVKVVVTIPVVVAGTTEVYIVVEGIVDMEVIFCVVVADIGI